MKTAAARRSPPHKNVTVKHMGTTSPNILQRLRLALCKAGKFLIQRDALGRHAAKCDCCFSPASRDTVQQCRITQARRGVCPPSAPAGRQMRSETQERPQVNPFLPEEFPAPSNAQLCELFPSARILFLCLNKDGEWLKGCEKPVFFLGACWNGYRWRCVTCQRAWCLPSYPWRLLWIRKPFQEMWDEEVKGLDLVHRLWGPWLWNASECREKYCPGKAEEGRQKKRGRDAKGQGGIDGEGRPWRFIPIRLPNSCFVYRAHQRAAEAMAASAVKHFAQSRSILAVFVESSLNVATKPSYGQGDYCVFVPLGLHGLSDDQCRKGWRIWNVKLWLK